MQSRFVCEKEKKKRNKFQKRKILHHTWVGTQIGLPSSNLKKAIKMHVAIRNAGNK